MSKKITWSEKTVEIGELKDYEHNPRFISEEAFNRLVENLKRFGYHNRIRVNTDLTIIGGHQRKKALLAAGFKNTDKVAVLVPSRLLTLEEFDDDNIVDNLQFGEYDFETLTERFDSDHLIELGMPEEWLEGFNVEPEELPPLEEEEVVEPPQEPVTVLGDVYEIGKHRLVCGDSVAVDDVDKLMVGKKADMVFTDPPYLMNFTGGVHGDGSKSFNSTHGAIKNDKMTKTDGEQFLDNVNSIISNYCTGAFYITFYRLGIGDYWKSLEKNGLKVRSLIIWHKGNHTLSNSDYMSKYEPIFYGWCDEHKFYGGNNGMDIWEISRTAKNDLHPTMKPIELVETALNNSSKKGQSVLDLFGGSGSTMVAAERTKRICYMMELDPKYCDVVITRMAQLFPELPIKLNGKTIDWKG